MKKMLLFIAAGLMMITTAQATTSLAPQDNYLQGELTRYRNAQPVLFTLNGIDFAVYPTGQVEFELPDNVRQNSRWNRRANNRYRTGNRYYRSNSRRNFVRYNRYGQVTKIGTTRISYYASGQVARIGHLDVDYTVRNNTLRQIGGLEVRYNRRGQLIAARGHVNERQHFAHNHDCSTHTFGTFHDDHQDQDWSDGVFFKRGNASE